MEACRGAHFLARALVAQEHTVKLMPAEYVRPFVKSNKNDYVDAEAIAEAVQRPTMRFVPQPLPKVRANGAVFSPDGGKTWEVNWICELTR